MRKWLGLSRVGLLALVGVALLFAGCNQQQGGSGGGSGNVTTGKVVLVVVDNATGASVSGYNVTFNPAISDPSAVQPGDYTVTVEKTGYFKAEAAFKVMAGATTTVTVNLVPIPPPPATGGQVAVLVIDESGSPIAGATVSDGSQSATTDAQGRADLSYGSDGTVAISVNASGYFGAAQLAQVEMGKTVALTFVLKEVPPPAPTTGTLAVFVYDASTNQGLAGATVTSGSLSFSASGALYTATDVAPGTYTVHAEKAGYNAAERAGVVKAGEVTVINLGLRPIPPEPQTIGSIEILSLKDQWGVELVGVQEENPAKDVKLYASQTEEPVCVTVKVLDPEGAPVPNARVRVSAGAKNDEGNANSLTRLFAGCTNTSEVLDFVKTDANGIAKFSFFNVGDNSDFYLYDSPVKFVVSATDANDQTAKVTEFKVFFYNVSHLYYAEVVDGIPQGEQYTGQRWGKDLGVFTNAFDFDNNDHNAHTFGSYVRRRQPTSDLIPPQSFAYGGYVVYTLSGPGADKVQFTAGCDVESLPSETTCTDTDGSGVTINTKPSVTAADLPVTVQVTAEWHVTPRYGETTYDIPLKSYTFTKTWTGANLSIEKTCSPIMTWTGSDLSRGDVTLPANDAGAASKHYECTITVTNTGTTDAVNVVINDNLPAELGLAAASMGGTYDPVLHKVTWDYNTTPALTTIAPGASVTVSMSVYPRQKPGYAWDDNDQNGTSDGGTGTYGGSYADGYADPGYVGHFHDSRPPKMAADTAYDDPYNIFNSADARGENTPYVTTDTEIWVVRPFMELDKVAAVSGPFYVGDAIPFDITVTNVDRADLGDPGYQYLKATFPTEYANEMSLYNVKLRDLFAEGLDFVDAIPGGSLDADSHTYTWDVGELAIGASQTLRIWLRGALDGAWENCARGYANNLNQQVDIVSGYPVYNVEPTQTEPSTGTDPRPSPPYTLETGNPDSLGNYIEACDTVRVQPRPTSPVLTITTLGEHTTPDNGPGSGIDPVTVGNSFWYLFRSHIVGTAQTNYTLTVAFPAGGEISPTGTTAGTDVKVYISTDGGVTYTEAPASSYTVTLAGSNLTVSYIPGLAADTLVRVSVRAVANTATGSPFTITAQASTTESGVVGPVSENTTVQP